MAQSVTIAGITFPDVPSILVPKSTSGNAIYVDPSPTTATASDVAQGKTFFTAIGELATGTASGGGGAYPWLGEGAEKFDTKDLSFNLSSGTSYDSWTPSTTAGTIRAANDSAYTLSANFNSYDYCIVTRGFIEPVYVSGTPATYRTHRVAQYLAIYLYGYPLSSSVAQVQANEIGGATALSTNTNTFIQEYYSNNGVLTARGATQCGPCYMSTTPSTTTGTVSDGSATVTYKLPAFYAKCDSSRFSTTRAGQVDSANTNYSLILEVYRVPHGKGLLSYWVSAMCAALNA